MVVCVLVDVKEALDSVSVEVVFVTVALSAEDVVVVVEDVVVDAVVDDVVVGVVVLVVVLVVVEDVDDVPVDVVVVVVVLASQLGGTPTQRSAT